MYIGGIVMYIGEYVYTKKGEERAKSIGQNDRKAGEPALCGGMPVWGNVAVRWMEKGYICKKEDYHG